MFLYYSYYFYAIGKLTKDIRLIISNILEGLYKNSGGVKDLGLFAAAQSSPLLGV
jgi:hypothetical protein